MYELAAIERLTNKVFEAAIKTAVLARKPRMMSDSGGLLLEAQPSGAGWWRLRFATSWPPGPARNPAGDLRDALPPVPARHLAAIVEPTRAAELLRAMGDHAGQPRHAICACAVGVAVPAAGRTATTGMGMGRSGGRNIDDSCRADEAQARQEGERHPTPCAARAAGRDGLLGVAPALRAWSIRDCVAAHRRAMHERKQRERGASAHGLRSRDGDGPRASRHGSHDGRQAAGR